MKRLLLLRHAKAEQANKDDHARKLTRRGRGDAGQMGAWIQKNRFEPDLVLCSTSARTRETWTIVSEELGTTPRSEFLKPLYLAPANAMLQIIRNVGDDANTLLLIGHNPGIEEAAAVLARTTADNDERHLLEQLKEKYPTAALAVLNFDVARWSGTTSASGTLTDFIRPKDLD